MVGCLIKLFGVGTLLVAIAIGLIWHKLTDVPDVPDIRTQYWGAGSLKKDDVTIKPFKISYSEDDYQDLIGRLNKTRMSSPLEGIGFQYGFNTNYLKKIVEYWISDYDWEKRKKYLNKFPQYKTKIGGLNIHFLHVKPESPKGKKVLPLLLLHGWPGSVREFYEILPLLTTPKDGFDFVFEVVAPSLPGYGFSDAPVKPGLGPVHISSIMNDLMERLGFQHYYVQGGDWGSVIGASLAIIRPEKVVGYHSNFCAANSKFSQLQLLLANIFPWMMVDSHRHDDFREEFPNLILESGYFHIQATKPDTVGVGLSDSPAGLAAYIMEKFSTWTKREWRDLPDGGLEHYDKDALLDNIMIYWITNSITTSVRLYSETFSRKYRDLKLDEIPITTPTACARFKNEIMFVPTSILVPRYKNLFQITDYETGGHFAAFEVPEILSDDIWNFVQNLSVKGKKSKQL